MTTDEIFSGQLFAILAMFFTQIKYKSNKKTNIFSQIKYLSNMITRIFSQIKYQSNKQTWFFFKSNENQIYFVKIKSNKLKLESFIKYGFNNHNRIFKIVYKLISSFPIRRKREDLAYYGSKYFHNCIQFMLWNNTNC